MFRPLSWIGNTLYKRGERRAPLKTRSKRTLLRVELLEDRLAPATLYFQGMTNNWNDTTNWTGGALPSPLDDVVFTNPMMKAHTTLNVNTFGIQVRELRLEAGFTLNIASELNAVTFRLTGGVVNGAGTFYVSQLLDWTGGTMAGAGITSILTAATANVALTATGGIAQPLGDTRIFDNNGITNWNGPLNISSGAMIQNDKTFNFTSTNLTFSTATPIQNTDTLTFNQSNLTFNGPLTLGSHLRVLNTTSQLVTINGNVTLQNFTLGSDLTGPGTLTVTNTFTWLNGKMSAAVTTGGSLVGSTIVAATGTLDLASTMTRTLDGRTLTVHGQRVSATSSAMPPPPPGSPPPPAGGGGSNVTVYASIGVLTTSSFSNPDLPFDNKSVKPAAPAGPTPFDPNAAAGALYRAMFGGMTGAGTDSETIYRTMEGIRTQGDLNNLDSAYTRIHPGRDLLTDLQSELSGDQWYRAHALYFVNWNKYVAASIHDAMFGWSLTNDVDLIVRLLEDSRTASAQVGSIYAVDYRNQTTGVDANLLADFQSKFSGRTLTLVQAAFNGNTALADAAWFLVHMGGTYSLVDAQAIFDRLSRRTPPQIALMRQEYATLTGANTFDADLAVYLGSTSTNFGVAQAILGGNKIHVAVAQLNLAMNRIGTDEPLVWKTLTGLYADERAMVAQVYRQTYAKTLMQDIGGEFSDSAIFGKDLSKTLKIYTHGGLTVAEQFYFGLYGWGTDDPDIQAAVAELSQMSAGEVILVSQEYQALSGVTLASALDADLDGRDWFRADQALSGLPTDPKQRLLAQVQRVLDEYNFEVAGLSNAIGNGVQWVFNNHGAAVDAAVTQMQTARNDFQADQNNQQKETTLRDALAAVRQHLQTFQEGRDATTDVFANTLATAAGIGVVVLSGGAATPIVVAIAAGVGGATQALTRMGVSGTFSWEQLPADFALGAVNAGTAALSFPAATRAAILNGTAQIGVLRQIAGSAFAGGASAGGLSAALNENTWSQGFAAGVINVAQVAGVTGFGNTLLPGTIGASVFFMRRALPFVSRVTTNTGITVANIFDAPWVRNFAAGTQDIQAYLSATLSGWSNKLDDIANRLLTVAPNETEAVTRQALRDILDTTTWNQIQRDFILDNAMGTLSRHRGQLPSLSLAGTRDLLGDGARMSMMAQKRTVDALRTHVTFTSAGGTASSFTNAEIDALAARLAALPNADDATIRIALEVTVGAGNASTTMVRRVRHLMFSGDLSAFTHAADYGIQPYGVLRDEVAGMGLRCHHLIERRFAALMGWNERQMLSIVLTPTEHQVFTNRWHIEVPYGSSPTPDFVLQKARVIYAAYPDILRALGL